MKDRSPATGPLGGMKRLLSCTAGDRVDEVEGPTGEQEVLCSGKRSSEKTWCSWTGRKPVTGSRMGKGQLVLFGTGEFNVPPELSESRCDMAPFGGPHEITLNLSNSDFLLVDKHPGDTAPQFRHFPGRRL
jgi:hypothetical protein